MDTPKAENSKTDNMYDLRRASPSSVVADGLFDVDEFSCSAGTVRISNVSDDQAFKNALSKLCREARCLGLSGYWIISCVVMPVELPEETLKDELTRTVGTNGTEDLMSSIRSTREALLAALETQPSRDRSTFIREMDAIVAAETSAAAAETGAVAAPSKSEEIEDIQDGLIGLDIQERKSVSSLRSSSKSANSSSPREGSSSLSRSTGSDQSPYSVSHEQRTNFQAMLSVLKEEDRDKLRGLFSDELTSSRGKRARQIFKGIDAVAVVFRSVDVTHHHEGSKKSAINFVEEEKSWDENLYGFIRAELNDYIAVSEASSTGGATASISTQQSAK